MHWVQDATVLIRQSVEKLNVNFCKISTVAITNKTVAIHNCDFW